MKIISQSKIKIQNCQEIYFVYFLFFIVASAVHWILPLNWADDAVFNIQTSGVTLLEFLNGRARPLSDTMTYIFSHHKWLWRLLNPIVLTLLPVIIEQLLPFKLNNRSKIIFCVLITIPAMVLVDAGFIATTVNYLWPTTFGLASMLSLKALINHKPIKPLTAILLWPAQFYASNMQQMCVVMCAVFLFGLIYYKVLNRHINGITKDINYLYVLLQLIMSCALLLYSYYLNTNGDHSRLVRETAKYFPEFAQLDFFSKLELGFSSTFYCLTTYIQVPWFIFLILVIYFLIMLIRNKSSKFMIVFAFLSSITVVLSGILELFPTGTFPFFEQINGGMQHDKMTKASYEFHFAADLIFVLIAVFVVLSIFSIIHNSVKRIYVGAALLLGLGTRMMMGFSPTVWASGNRTFCLMFVSLIFVVLFIIEDSQSQKITPNPQEILDC